MTTIRNLIKCSIVFSTADFDAAFESDDGYDYFNFYSYSTYYAK